MFKSIDKGFSSGIMTPQGKGGLCMLGGIYSDQRCSICGNKLRDNSKSVVSCPIHPQIIATKLRVKFRGVSRRFENYSEATRFLTGLRFKIDEGVFDAREYRQHNPLGFETLALKWLQIRKSEVGPEGISENTYRALREGIEKGIAAFGNQSIKHFRLIDFQIFLAGLNVRAKSKYNYIQTLRQFFKWLLANRELESLPEFPVVAFELARRRTIDKETQLKVLDEIRAISNFKTWLGIKWLTTYINLRPEECRNIREGEIDLKQGEILIPHPKEKRAKIVYLIDEDIELIKSLPKAIDPKLPFFRHSSGRQFGEKYFYKWWKRACKNLKIEGVDLYVGTRHSSARALRKYYSPEQIRAASMHSTDKSFERYFWQEGDDLRKIYSNTQAGQKLAKDFKAV
jgi:integrase